MAKRQLGNKDQVRDTESLKIYDAEHHLVGKTLPMEEHVYRLKDFKIFLRAAVPLAKLDVFHDLLQENAID